MFNMGDLIRSRQLQGEENMTLQEDTIQEQSKLKSMKFPGELEQLFNDDLFEKSLGITRFSLALAFLLYRGSVFLILSSHLT